MDLKLDERNFGIYGPNGTGKSGIVDAIEFALTGGITRLSGKGLGGVSLKNHAPHVDVRSDPSKALVSLRAFSPDLNKSFTIERTVGNPKNPVVKPTNDADLHELVRTLGEHPEFALSRREILKYVIAEPGQRSQEVQALLRLDSIETLRKALKRTENDATKALDGATIGAAQAKSHLLTALKVSQLTADRLLSAVNERRGVLGLEPLAELGKDTTLKAGVVGGAAKTDAAPAISKTHALADLANLERDLSRSGTDEEFASRVATRELLANFISTPSLLIDLQRHDFYARGLDFVLDAVCPLCDTAWDPDALKAHIQEKLSSANAAVTIKTNLVVSSQPLRAAVAQLNANVGAVKRLAKSFGLSAVSAELEPYEVLLTRLEAAITDVNDVGDVVDRLESPNWRSIVSDVATVIEPVRAAAAQLPEPSALEEATDFLIRAEERLDVYRTAQRSVELWKTRLATAKEVATTFEEVSKVTLTTLYEEVQADFAKFYATIHSDDESTFLGKLTPSLAKLNFEVDFYGRGLFPPGAYHSEGHQDSMGLCLYLALMRKVLGEAFTLAVLDDVLMSVDAGHRREVCALLRKEFPTTQFVFTTHDKVWLNHLVTEKLLSKGAVKEFRRWTVDDGPVEWDSEDVWGEIDRALVKGDVSEAASTLRRFLERTSAILAARLRAKVEYKIGAEPGLGELFDAAMTRFDKLLGDGVRSAKAWGKVTVLPNLQERQTEFAARLKRCRGEQWTVNASVHYNEWNNLSPAEFRAVASAYKELVASFECEMCGVLVFVVPPNGSSDSLRCDCAHVNINLKDGPSQKGPTVKSKPDAANAALPLLPDAPA